MFSRLTAVLLVSSAVFAAENVDLDVVHRIKHEAFENSQVMDTLSALTDRYGPRLTGSPEMREAADWALARLKSYGLENGHLEKWGPFARSWSLRQYAVEMVGPRYALLNATPMAWTQTTNGPITAEVIWAPLETSWAPKKAEQYFAEFQAKYRGKLRGKIVLLSKIEEVTNENKPLVERYTDAQLAAMAKAPEVFERPKIDLDHLDIPEDARKRHEFFSTLPRWAVDKIWEERQREAGKRMRFLREEGVAAILRTDPRANEGLIFTEAAGYYKDPNLAPPTFALDKEQYNRIVRLTERKEPVRVRVNLDAEVSKEPVDSFNVVAEIPGGSKKDELVMIGGHFDSWHSGTGATDNASGSAVMMEVARILKTLNLKLDRTVRIGLWGGEEEGLLGSAAYVKEHFADRATMRPTAEHAKLSGYFNLDNGAGKIRGVYLEDNDAMRPIFEQWFAPFRDMGVTTTTLQHTGGTDHESFDDVGLPGFQFIQDPLDYMTVTHHSNMDVYDHAPAGDLMEASAVIAAVVYEAANRPEMLPRKPLPPPQHEPEKAAK